MECKGIFFCNYEQGNIILPLSSSSSSSCQCIEPCCYADSHFVPAMRVGLSIKTIKRTNQLIHASLLSVTAHKFTDSQKFVFCMVLPLFWHKSGGKKIKYKRLMFNQREHTRHALYFCALSTEHCHTSIRFWLIIQNLWFRPLSFSVTS